MEKCGSVEGEVLECMADLLEGTLCWSKGDKILAYCAVPEEMRGKPTYLSIILINDGD